MFRVLGIFIFELLHKRERVPMLRPVARRGHSGLKSCNVCSILTLERLRDAIPYS